MVIQAIQGRAELFSTDDQQWSDLLERVKHDVYHTPAYHAVPGFGRDGDAFVFSYLEGNRTFLWPYLLTPLRDGWADVTSVYGYGGPVCHGDDDFVHRAWLELLDHWRSQNVVSAFTRFHPLLGNSALLQGLTDSGGRPAERGSRSCGSTISIDLSLPPEDQVRKYQKVLRQEIRKTRELGFTTFEDTEWRYVDDFVRLYRETMERRKSRSEYLIDSDWVHDFRMALGGNARLFITKWNGIVAASLLTMIYPPFLHAHLTGIEADLVVHSPLKILLDDVRIWGAERGLQSFHLGGGVGGREDSLFQFKRRFSPVTHEFTTGGWILNTRRYRELEAEHRRCFQLRGIDIGEPEFFPIYRYQV